MSRSLSKIVDPDQGIEAPEASIIDKSHDSKRKHGDAETFDQLDGART